MLPEPVGKILTQSQSLPLSGRKSKEDLTYTCGNCGRTVQPVEVNDWPGIGGTVYKPVSCICKQEAYKRDQEQLEQRGKIIRLQKYFSLADVGEELKNASFDNWERSAETQNAYNESKLLVSQWDQRKASDEGLLLFGEPGCGKSHMAASIAKKLDARDKSVLFINVSEFMKRLENTFGKTEQELKLLNSMKCADLVILDDVGLGVWTKIERGKFEDIFATLNFNKIMVVITTNLHPATNMEDYLGARTLDRIIRKCRLVENKGTSYRRKIAERRLNQ